MNVKYDTSKNKRHVAKIKITKYVNKIVYEFQKIMESIVKDRIQLSADIDKE